ncbi:hypothetical protein METP3_00649 [Methanosarcinales archaeon]|nr:hypothetical protein METP3_00649 [Methanosarcinales archaeon]
MGGAIEGTIKDKLWIIWQNFARVKVYSVKIRYKDEKYFYLLCT